jgi:hypothetical protein
MSGTYRALVLSVQFDLSTFFFLNACTVINFGVLCFVSAPVTVRSCLHPLLCPLSISPMLFLFWLFTEIMEASLAWKIS